MFNCIARKAHQWITTTTTATATMATPTSSNIQGRNISFRGGSGERILTAIDFDLTIIAQDSCETVYELLPKQELHKLHYMIEEHGWLMFMRKVLRQLYTQHHIGSHIIGQRVRHIRPVPGMMRLLRQIATCPQIDMYILSDANSFFIGEWLTAHGLCGIFNGICTNPVTVQCNGNLILEAFHQQSHCRCCPTNLCKGDILHKLRQRTDYKHVIYVGDGENDFCPIQNLQSGDFACIRRDHELDIKLKEEAAAATTATPDIGATVLRWCNGHELLEQLVEGGAMPSSGPL